MLPDAQNPVTRPPYGSGVAPVAGTVQADFSMPVALPRLRRHIAARAPVPEATVYKDGELRRRKEKIRPGRQTLRMKPPSSDSGPYQSGPEAPLGRTIAPTADGSHVARAGFGDGPERFPAQPSFEDPFHRGPSSLFWTETVAPSGAKVAAVLLRR